MRRLNLTKPQFKQAAVVAITGLSRAAIQTRVNRGEIQLSVHHPGRHAKRLFSVLDLLKLYFIETMVRHGLQSRIAVMFADDIAARAVEWWAERPETMDADGVPHITLKTVDWQKYKKGYLFVEKYCDPRLIIGSDDSDGNVLGYLSLHELFGPPAFYVIQVDILISSVINKTLRFIHQNPDSGAGGDGARGGV